MTNPEAVIIGASLMHSDSLLDALESIKPHHFEDQKNQKIWEWMSQRSVVGAPVDASTVLDHFGASEAVRVSEYMDAATQLGVSVAGACDTLIRGYQRKVLLQGLQAAHRAAQGSDPLSAVPLIEASLTALQEGKTNEDATPISEVLDDAMLFLMQRQEAKESGKTVYIPTGIRAFDERMDGGGAPEELIVIAARPGMGKTEVLTNAAEYQALNCGVTIIHSLEMSKRQLGLRMVRNASDVDIRKHVFTPHEWDVMENTLTDIHSAKLFIDDTAAISVATIRRRALRIRRRHGPLAAMWIDYLQLMTGDGQNRETVVAGISRDLKALAKDLQCPVFLLAQLNRSCEARQDKRPLLSDLRESGAVEQDADAVCMLYRDAYYNPDTSTTPFELELLFRKFRRGQPGRSSAGWANGRIYDTPESARDAR